MDVTIAREEVDPRAQQLIDTLELAPHPEGGWYRQVYKSEEIVTRHHDRAQRRAITTVEGLAGDGALSALQRSFIEHGALQCGFCTPGMLMAAHALRLRCPAPTEADVVDALAGNVCRCTGYRQIIDAVLACPAPPR